MAISAVGALQKQIRQLDIVVSDQFKDLTKNRPTTFFEEGALAHVTVGEPPFCTNLSHTLIEIREKIFLG